jgi:hypothetical protein
MMTKRLYLFGAIIGTVLPYAFLISFFLQHGMDLSLFVQQMTANPIARMFTADLFISSFVFWVFLFSEGRRLEMGNLWLYVALNLLVGLSLALPLFLYFREGALESATAARPSAAGAD